MTTQGICQYQRLGNGCTRFRLSVLTLDGMTWTPTADWDTKDFQASQRQFRCYRYWRVENLPAPRRTQ